MLFYLYVLPPITETELLLALPTHYANSVKYGIGISSYVVLRMTTDTGVLLSCVVWGFPLGYFIMLIGAVCDT